MASLGEVVRRAGAVVTFVLLAIPLWPVLVVGALWKLLLKRSLPWRDELEARCGWLVALWGVLAVTFAFLLLLRRP